ncbi:MAG: HAD-IB family phosphatase [Thermoproteota archaeon]
MKKFWIFTDFDGTISNPDTIDLLGKIFDRPKERADMYERMISGLLTPKEWLSWEIGLVDAPLEKVLRFLNDVVVIDPNFPTFVDWCQEMEIPLTILSNGLEEIIRSLLERFHLDHIRVEANHLEKDRIPWKTVFRDNSAWGHDKSAHLKESRRRGYLPVFIGDGVSDRDAALCAEIIFAKRELASFCEQKGLKYYRFASFGEIGSIIRQVTAKFYR